MNSFKQALLITLPIGIANEVLANLAQLWIYHPRYMTVINCLLMFGIVLPYVVSTVWRKSLYIVFMQFSLIGMAYELLDHYLLHWASFPSSGFMGLHQWFTIRFSIALLWGLVGLLSVLMYRYLHYRSEQTIDWSAQIVWLTGASSGLGKSLGLELLDRGAQLIVSARNHEALNNIYAHYEQTQVLIAPCDITQKKSLQNVIQHIERKFGKISLLITNAGVCQYTHTEIFNAECFMQNIAVNTLGSLQCIEYALPLLQHSESPRILAISSLARYFGLPFGMDAYAASKAALSVALDGLRFQKQLKSVQLHIAHAGFIDTPMSQKNNFHMPGLISCNKATQNILEGIEDGKLEINFPGLTAVICKIAFCLPVYWRRAFLNYYARFSQ